nr:gtp cyclohydrolase 1 [Quercus suber]
MVEENANDGQRKDGRSIINVVKSSDELPAFAAFDLEVSRSPKSNRSVNTPSELFIWHEGSKRLSNMDHMSNNQLNKLKPKGTQDDTVDDHSPLHASQSAELKRDDQDTTYQAIKASMGAKREALTLEELSLKDRTRQPPGHVNGTRTKSAEQYEEVEDKDIEDLVSRIDNEKVRIARDMRDEAPATPLAVNHSEPSLSQHPAVDFDGLSWPSVGTLARMQDRESPEDAQKRLKKLSDAVRTILECIGEDPDREGLHGTPERYAKAMMFFTKGYEENLRDIVNNAVFHEDHEELVIVRDIDVYSLCEHHLVPFTGKMHIGYVPSRRVIGLSKLARIADMFSRRLQVQERLTKQVALALSEVLKPQGVAVVMESSHLCMVMRGVEKAGAITTTSCMLGAMRRRAKTREEFLNLLNRGR